MGGMWGITLFSDSRISISFGLVILGFFSFFREFFWAFFGGFGWGYFLRGSLFGAKLKSKLNF